MLKDLVMKNRSYRGYDENYIVTEKELRDIVDHARLAPASRNMQPLCYYLVHNKETAKEIVGITKWAAALPDITLPKPNTYPTSFIIICQNLEIMKDASACKVDVGIVAQTMLLAATEMELGGCMIGLFKPDEIAGLLNINTDKYVVKLVVAIGKPAEEIVLTEVVNGETTYYRDDNNTHFVPKRTIDDIIISN